MKNTPSENRKWLTFTSRVGAQKWIQTSPYPHAPIALQIEDLTFLHQAALAGHGMTRSACYMADPEENLMRLPGAKPEPVADIWILTHPDLKNSPRVQALMKFLAAVLMNKRALIEGRPDTTL